MKPGQNSGKRWVFIYRRASDGKRCEMGLGGVMAVPLASARKKAEEARRLLADGKDPRAVRVAEKDAHVIGEALR